MNCEIYEDRPELLPDAPLACGMYGASDGRRAARNVSGRRVWRYACRRVNVSALGTLMGTTGRLRLALRLEGRERGRGGRSVQYAASTSACVGWSGTVAESELELETVKDATVGVVGAEGEDLEDEMARMCVGKAEELGV